MSGHGPCTPAALALRALNNQHLGPCPSPVLHRALLHLLLVVRLPLLVRLFPQLGVLLQLEAVPLLLLFLDLRRCLHLRRHLSFPRHGVRTRPLLHDSLLFVREVLLFNLAVEGHHRLARLRALDLLPAGPKLDRPALGLVLDATKGPPRLLLHLADLLDAPLGGLCPLLVEVALLTLAPDPMAALVNLFPLLDDAPIDGDHYGQVLLLLRVPAYDALGALDIRGVVRQEVHLVLLHLQATLLGGDGGVPGSAQVELLHGRLAARAAARRGRLLPAQRLAVDLHVPAIEGTGTAGRASCTGCAAAAPGELSALPLRHARAVAHLRPRGRWLRRRRRAACRLRHREELAGAFGEARGSDGRSVQLCLFHRAHGACRYDVAHLLDARAEAAQLLDERSTRLADHHAARGVPLRLVGDVPESGVAEALQAPGASAVLEHLLRPGCALLRRRGARLVVDVVGRHHGLVEAVEHRALLLQHGLDFLHLVLQARHGADYGHPLPILRSSRGGGGAVGQRDLVAQEEHELRRVGQVVQGHQRRADARPAGARRPPGAVDEELGARREVKVQDVVEEWDVDATGCDVGGHEDSSLAFAEPGHLLKARDLVHGSIDYRCRQPKLRQELAEELHVVPCGDKHDRGLLLPVQVAEDRHGRGELLVLPHVQIPQVQSVAYRRLNIEADKDRVLHSRAREGDELRWQGRGEEEALPRGGRLLQDLLQLFRESELKEPVRLVEDEYLDAR
mmetsp:Transcript_58414/g.156376  ORF Transcript_58414/g.156376 Transcript_58414/m.156376 type:complete len:736 (-) Transcript_58414:531-2738(-)